MVTLAGIGSFASGIGSLASGLGFGKDKGPGFMEQANNQVTLQRKLTNAKFDSIAGNAKKHGLHMLSAMGIQPSQGSISYQSGGGVDLNEMGQGVDRALNAGRNKLQRQLDELALEKASLENDYLRTQIAGTQKQLLQTGRPPALPHQSDLNIIDGSNDNNIRRVASDRVSNVRGNIGLEAAPTPSWKKFYLDNDTSILLPPNQSIDEMGHIAGTIKSAELARKGIIRPWLLKYTGEDKLLGAGDRYFGRKLRKFKQRWKK